MNADEPKTGGLKDYAHAELTERVIGVFYDVYNELGFGFLESVYSKAMRVALAESGLEVQSEYPITVWFREQQVGEFRADLVVESVLLLELKSMRTLEPVHESQMLNYLRATDLETALLFNFGPKPQFRRLAFSNQRKKICVDLRSSAAKGSSS